MPIRFAVDTIHVFSRLIIVWGATWLWLNLVNGVWQITMSRYVSPFSAYIEKPEALSTLCVLNRFHLQVSDIPVARTRSHKGMGAQEMERRHIEPWEMCNYSKSPVIFFFWVIAHFQFGLAVRIMRWYFCGSCLAENCNIVNRWEVEILIPKFDWTSYVRAML